MWQPDPARQTAAASTTEEIPRSANEIPLEAMDAGTAATRIIPASEATPIDEGGARIIESIEPITILPIPKPEDQDDTERFSIKRFFDHHRKTVYGTLATILLLIVAAAVGRHFIIPSKAYLGIDSDPQGAEIYVDDIALKRMTPQTLELAPGSHRVRLHRDGYKDWEKIVHLEKGKEHSENSSLEPIERLALLKLKSTPAGAEVYVDENPTARGTTPMDLKLPLGDHVVSLRKPQYSPWKEKVPLKEEREYRKDVTLERIPPPLAALKMDSSPLGAEFFVDGASKGVTPLKVDLSVGTYTLRLFKDGFKPWEKKIPLNEARLYQENIALEPRTGTRTAQVAARITSTPANADLYIDGVPVGKTPLTVTKPAGTYSLRMESEGYEPWDSKVTWEKAQETVHAKLAPIPVPVQPASEMATLNVSTSPVSAQLFVNNEFKGNTPISLKLPANKPYKLTMKAEKYQSEVQNCLSGHKHEICKR